MTMVSLLSVTRQQQLTIVAPTATPTIQEVKITIQSNSIGWVGWAPEQRGGSLEPGSSSQRSQAFILTFKIKQRATDQKSKQELRLRKKVLVKTRHSKVFHIHAQCPRLPYGWKQRCAKSSPPTRPHPPPPAVFAYKQGSSDASLQNPVFRHRPQNQ